MTEKKDLAKFKRELLKKKRDVRRKALGKFANEDDNASVGLRNYTEKTKTILALKVEMFGAKNKGKETTIEVWFEELLNKHAVKFKKQKAVRYLNYDFFLSDFNLLVEIQGCYFHCCNLCYPEGPKNDLQRGNLKKNEVKRGVAKSKNYDLWEVWAHEIENEKEKIEAELLKRIKTNEQK